jgi:hypothetical protein
VPEAVVKALPDFEQVVLGHRGRGGGGVRRLGAQEHAQLLDISITNLSQRIVTYNIFIYNKKTHEEWAHLGLVGGQFLRDDDLQRHRLGVVRHLDETLGNAFSKVLVQLT